MLYLSSKYRHDGLVSTSRISSLNSIIEYKIDDSITKIIKNFRLKKKGSLKNYSKVKFYLKK